METQTCSKLNCSQINPQPISNFYFRKDSNKFTTVCKTCKAKQSLLYRAENQDSIKESKSLNYQLNKTLSKQKNYYSSHKEEILAKRKIYYIQNKEKIKAYKLKYYASFTKEEKLQEKLKRKKYRKKKAKYLAAKQRAYYATNKKKCNDYVYNRALTDPIFRLRKHTSKVIGNILKNNNSSKNGESIMKYLPYSIEELKKHLEAQFEPWMNWNNWGKYCYKDWKEKDSSTWKWQIDHIIPQSLLPYSSMEEANFQKAWALSNLRPLSAKQNASDGGSQIRHKLESSND